jgi:ADP-ribose pyrophosphatase YjhB (NUDIX family)
MTADDRLFPARPIVGVGAIVVDGGRVLLVKRGRPPLHGEWSVPGGAVEVGETLSAAVQREVLEETGLVVSVGAMVEVLDRIHTNSDGRVEYHYVLVDYLCSAVGGALQARSDALDAVWAPADRLAEYAVQPATVAVIQRAVHLAHNVPS